jgi:tRNA A37 threonylcarbamoyladenosine modification protein TsaB
LIEEFVKDEKTSTVLPRIFEDILNRYEIEALYYTRGPGSFMAIKISYIFLKSLSISLNIPLYATDGFVFNENSPIKAIGNLYFMKENGKIQPKKIGDKDMRKGSDFKLPKKLEREVFTDEIEPLYILPAVKETN